MFQKAAKEKAKLRCAIFGPSGSGKTYSALRIANGITGKIALIDTEHHSACKYADKFDFDVANLENKNIDYYCHAITEAANCNYNIIIIDSLSHAWEELLEDIEKLTRTKYCGNSFRAWAEGTPKQKKLINALLSCPAHIICTIRSKTEWLMEENGKGRKAPIRIGVAPEQRKGIE